MINCLWIGPRDMNWKDSGIPRLTATNFTKTIRLTNKNFTKISQDDALVDCLTSVEDIEIENLELVLDCAKEIKIVGIFDLVPTEDMSETNYDLLYLLNRSNKVIDKVSENSLDCMYQRLNYKSLSIERPNKNTTLWISGCSVSHGTGVSPHEVYGELLSKKLKTQMVNLSECGKSLFWAVDRLLRADIRDGDTVVLGITNLARYEWADNWKLSAMPAVLPDKLEHIDLDYFDSPTNLLKSCHYIVHLINFCNKIGAKVIIANLLDITVTPIFFKDYPGYVDFSDIGIVDSNVKFLDLGTDNKHPGPKQHKHYADKIYQRLGQIG